MDEYAELVECAAMTPTGRVRLVIRSGGITAEILLHPDEAERLSATLKDEADRAHEVRRRHEAPR